MENPVDHTLDLGLVNYVQHPENSKYIVFRFADMNRAAFFESRLAEKEIWFEKGDEMKRNTNFQLYAIHSTDFKLVEKINYETEAKFKKPIIPSKILRYSLLLFSGIIMTLTLIGYCSKQKEIQQSMNNSSQSMNVVESVNK
ncbi:MAG: hypothetical protein N4A41_12640 [Crocinitomicaceae bacterium]|jgi:hypothetical protein|nr:hypothetical protein [Crocinitomicaceae bacterium]